MQAKDLDDAEVIAAVRACYVSPQAPVAVGWEVATMFPDAPPKVVQAKLRQLRKRGVLEGCDCGCRGDWHVAGDPWPS